MRRTFLTLLFISLGLSALTGCGGPRFTGSLPGRDGDGTGPKPGPGQAQITSLSPGTAVAGSSSLALTLNGLNFTPTTTVLWNDVTNLTTTYVSSTVLQAQVPASLIAKPGTATVGLAPLSSINFVTNFTITVQPLKGNNTFSVSMFPVQANDMAWDQASQQFYLSVAKGNGTNANTIAALDPATRVFTPLAATTSEPGKLSVSADGSFLYVGLDSANSLRRYALPSAHADIDIPLGSGSFGSYYAIDLAPAPGSSRSVAVSRGVKATSPREIGGVAIYDDAVVRPQSVPGFGSGGTTSIDTLLWNPDGQSLYGVDNGSAPPTLDIMSVNAAGVQLKSKTADKPILGSSVHFNPATGYLYSDSGKVIDPVSNTVVASFTFDTIQGGFSNTPLMALDSKLNIAYFLGQTVYNGAQGNYVIAAFDLTHYTLLGAIPVTNVSGTPSKLIRWGANGLAFLTGDLYGAGAAGDGVYLISGDFVTSPAP